MEDVAKQAAWETWKHLDPHYDFLNENNTLVKFNQWWDYYNKNKIT